MNSTQKYFIHLLSSHINNSPPEPADNVDWMGVFKLGELHNLSAMLCLSIKTLPSKYKPEKEIMSLFNQALGMTIQSYENKISGISILAEAFSDNRLRHLFLKGASIRKYYPCPEVRTSGDTDVIIDKDMLEKSAEILLNKGFSLAQKTDIQNVLFYKDEEYEIKNYIDYINDSCKEYFENTFDKSKVTSNNGYSFELKPIYHLIYVCSHLLMHLKSGGAGVRQLMDIDVLLRSGEIDLKEFFNIVRELQLEKSVSVLIALSKRYFNTPVEFNFEIDESLYQILEKVILEGGVFGFAISDPGTIRLIKQYQSGNNKSFLVSVRAMLSMFFPPKEYFYRYYEYARKHHILLFAAYFQRLFTAVFKRGKRNTKHIKTIFSDKSTASLISQMLDELEINKRND